MAPPQGTANVHNFSVGQSVRCIDLGGTHRPRLAEGCNYTVSAVYAFDIRLAESTGLWSAWRFEDALLPPRVTVDAGLPPASDAVFRPHHYARFIIEPLTFINANKLPYNIGNVVKYVCRFDAKNGLEDLKKARRYIDIQIECMERDGRVAAGENQDEVWKAVL